jgi:dihydroxy-acid dehydratase
MPATRRLKIKFDWISALLIVLLIATLTAFFTGVFPYPVGWIVLTALLVFRLTARQTKE